MSAMLTISNSVSSRAMRDRFSSPWNSVSPNGLTTSNLHDCLDLPISARVGQRRWWERRAAMPPSTPPPISAP